MAIIKIPEQLACEIDRIAGVKSRSAFAIDVLRREVRRNRQREALWASAGSWKSEDHPNSLVAEPHRSKKSTPNATRDARTPSPSRPNSTKVGVHIAPGSFDRTVLAAIH